MKKIVLLAASFMLGLAVMAQTKPEDIAKLNTEKHDFGKIKFNVPVTYYFEIKNISDKPVIVENARATCGCTVPEKPEKPIMPGETAKLKIQYSANAIGTFTKDVYIKLAGVDSEKVVKVVGEVLTAEAYDAWVKEKGNNKPNK